MRGQFRFAWWHKTSETNFAVLQKIDIFRWTLNHFVRKENNCLQSDIQKIGFTFKFCETVSLKRTF